MPDARLVMISGWAFPPRSWAQTVAHLAPSCVCHVIDGRDLLTAGGEPKHGGDTARILNDLVEIEPGFILGGWSMGALLAVQTAPRLVNLVRCTAMASAFGCPTTTTSLRPRVTAV